ncbi:phage antirepressor N-terminal domain-containing protein [Acinetobacter baumannii]|uniref:phage antirepressor N-terminal domain-containing protein n=1 Tax=Acinetobacter baumannii TaxID=470 RepID=UPI000AFDC4ED|nr:phage antirepressor N-terminal domain-containing protein [Acinetobacter baumannii]
MKSIDNKKARDLGGQGLIEVNIKEINMTLNSLTQITVPFHNTELLLVEHNGQPYTAMRPIVENIGLDWKTQLIKIKQRFNSVVGEIPTTGKDGKQYKMLCLPLKKLFGWLMTISPNKVKPELRDTVIKYQEECDDVLWDYWIKGQASNPRPKTHKSERTPLHDAHALLVAKTKHLNSSDAWKIINQRFGTNHIDEIPYDMIPVAVEYVHHLIAMYSGAEKKEQGSLFDKDAYELVRKLTEAVIIENDEIVPVLLAVKMLDVKKFAYYSHLVVKANEAARDVARLLDFRNLQNEPLIDADCSVIAMSNGQRFLARPNWFNCPA